MDVFDSCACRKVKKVQQWIEKTKETNVQDEKGWTLLMIATMNNDLEMVQLLLRANANPNLVTNNTNSTALMIACLGPTINVQIIKCLLDANADIDLKNKSGKTVMDMIKKLSLEKNHGALKLFRREGCLL